MWKLPSVDEWLEELHDLTPPQLALLDLSSGLAVRKPAPPPLFGTTPAVAARPTLAGEIRTANPLGSPEEEEQQEGWRAQPWVSHNPNISDAGQSQHKRPPRAPRMVRPPNRSWEVRPQHSQQEYRAQLESSKLSLSTSSAT